MPHLCPVLTFEISRCTFNTTLIITFGSSSCSFHCQKTMWCGKKWNHFDPPFHHKPSAFVLSWHFKAPFVPRWFTRNKCWAAAACIPCCCSIGPQGRLKPQPTHLQQVILPEAWRTKHQLDITLNQDTGVHLQLLLRAPPSSCSLSDASRLHWSRVCNLHTAVG